MSDGESPYIVAGGDPGKLVTGKHIAFTAGISFVIALIIVIIHHLSMTSVDDKLETSAAERMFDRRVTSNAMHAVEDLPGKSNSHITERMGIKTIELRPHEGDLVFVVPKTKGKRNFTPHKDVPVYIGNILSEENPLSSVQNTGNMGAVQRERLRSLGEIGDVFHGPNPGHLPKTADATLQSILTVG
jgi:hypothetical protein